MRAVYAIRHQAAGIILQFYVAEPSAEEIERVRIAHAVPGREHWARVVKLPIEVPPALAKHFAEATVAAPPDVVAEPRAMPRMAFKASATVINPR
jgi:hypothetical protein